MIPSVLEHASAHTVAVERVLLNGKHLTGAKWCAGCMKVTLQKLEKKVC